MLAASAAGPLSCRVSPPGPLRLGANLWIGYEPLFAAERLGLLDRDRVHLVELPSSSEVIRAFRNRSLDAAALTLDEVLILRSLGVDVVVFLVTDTSNGGDVVLGRPPISGVGDLRGKRVGVESGALGAYMLSRCLDAGGLTVGDITPVPVPVNEHAAAYESRLVDAVVTFEPVRSSLIKAGAVTLFSSVQIPGEIVDVLAVARDRVAAHPGQVEHLCDAWFRAVERFEAEPENMAALVGQRFKQPVVDVIGALELIEIPSRTENARLLGGDDPPLRRAGGRLQEVMVERGFLAGSLELTGLFDARFVRGTPIG
jgi:NitT/TauT family transport system substrate-binding protein